MWNFPRCHLWGIFPKVAPWEIPRIAKFKDSVPPLVKTSLARQCKIRAILILASSKTFLAFSPSWCKEDGLAQIFFFELFPFLLPPSDQLV